MSNAWNGAWSDAWAGSWGADAGIGLVDEGIGLAPPRVTPPLDFVVQGPMLANFRQRQKIFKIEARIPRERASSEMQEMHAMYASWRKAA